MQEDAIMIDQEMDWPASERLARLDQLTRRVDMAQALAAIIATTRRDWMSPVTASSAPDGTAVSRGRLAHPLIRFALDAKRGSVWRARIGRQRWIQSVVQLAQLDRTPEGSR
jgi:hypothetical protein